MINKFKIEKLFGNIDVEIPINTTNGIKILIGENGLGKTTVLNILYHALIPNYRKLSNYDFNKVVIEFSNGQKATLKHDNLKSYILYSGEHRLPEGLIQSIIDYIPDDELNEINKKIQTTGTLEENEIKNFPSIRNHRAARRYPIRVIKEALIIYCNEDLSKNLIGFKNKIQSNLKDIKILYFPTYRRIEEDLKNLNIEIEKDDRGPSKSSEKLIQFGMDDIKRRFKNIQDDIQKLSSIGLARISSEILSQLVKGAPKIDDFQLDAMNPESIQIILARVGSALSDDDKTKIVDMIRNKKLKEEDKFLVYFIQKLIEIYERQKNLDNKIKTYIEVCNGYLSFSKKKIIYNESEVEFYIESNFYREKKLLIEFLSKLSSGEKQILSLFSKIYLSEKDEKYLVLFDEPELSLSIYWQEKLLPDIIKSKRCENLIAATHSPFIYDNELSEYANGLSDYIKIEVEE